ncbi:MAG: HupE/UreJ family protein [Pseudomonadales bacterium]|nr:HupE/UreJ family protein [Pseudomonadales bacterium]
MNGLEQQKAFIKRLVQTLVTVCLWFLFTSNVVWAHLAGITDTSIQVGNSQVKVVYTLPTDSIQELFEEAERAKVTQGEIEGRIGDGFVVLNDQQICDLIEQDRKEITRVQSAQFIHLYDCRKPLDNLEIRYKLFVDEFKNHENFTRVSMGGKYVSLVFSADQTFVHIPVKETIKEWKVTLDNNFETDPNSDFQLKAQPNYFPLGIEHILLGFDHMLFLLALLLLPLGFKQLAIMVTSFTIAHSITLAVAVFDLLTLPAIWVEAVIALSIVYVGIENLVEMRGASAATPLVTPWKRRVIVTFFFGLIHGFGFSYVLKEIGLGDQVASALLFFNLGVEAGQLLAVIVAFPFLSWLYRRWPTLGFSKVCSVLVVLMGGFWLVERLMAAFSV